MRDEHQVIRLSRAVDESDHVLGPESASATLVEYGDYECPHCRELHPIIREIMNRTRGLRFVYRHFPISNIHTHAARAAEAAEAASAQGRFWEMHDALFEKEQPLDDEHLARCARKAGLDMERYTGEMAEGVYAEKVKKDYNSAIYGDSVTGTPTVYVNGLRLNNVQNMEALLEAVTDAGATLQTSDKEQTNWLARLRKFRFRMTRLSNR